MAEKNLRQVIFVSPKGKLILANTLFFGFIGPYVGDFLLLPMSAKITDVLTHLTLPFVIGFIPAVITGYYYGKSYLRHAATYGTVNTRSELWIGAKVGATVMLCISSLFMLALVFIDIWVYGRSIDKLSMPLSWICLLVVAASIHAAITATICTNLISTWNDRAVKKCFPSGMGTT